MNKHNDHNDIALLRQARAFDGEEHHRLLVGGDGGVGDYETDGGLVGVVLATADRDDEFSRHVISFDGQKIER